MNKYANEVETSVKQFRVVSAFYFSLISECATALTPDHIPTTELNL